MYSPIPHDLPPSLRDELIARFRDLDDQIQTLEGIFETLHLLTDSFGLDTPDMWSAAYRAQMTAGRRYVLEAHMKSKCIQTLFATSQNGGRNA